MEIGILIATRKWYKYRGTKGKMYALYYALWKRSYGHISIIIDKGFLFNSLFDGVFCREVDKEELDENIYVKVCDSSKEQIDNMMTKHFSGPITYKEMNCSGLVNVVFKELGVPINGNSPSDIMNKVIELQSGSNCNTNIPHLKCLRPQNGMALRGEKK